MQNNDSKKPQSWNNQELTDWIRAMGTPFEVIANVFHKNGVEGEDLFDEAIFSRESYDEMLESISTIFAKNKLWKKIQALTKNVHPKEPFQPVSQPPDRPFNRWARPPVMPFTLSSTMEKSTSSSNSIFAHNSFASPITRKSKDSLVLDQKLREPRRQSYSQLLRKSALPSRELAIPLESKLRKNRTKMMLWRGLDAKSNFEPEILESYLETAFNVTFRYQYSTNRFSVYGEEASVRNALKAIEDQNLTHEPVFDHLYDVDSLELHISPRDRRTLLQNEELTKFIQENEVQMFSEATDMTKPNGEKKIRLLLTGPKMPETANMVAGILFRDFSKVYTNFIFSSKAEDFDAIMTNQKEPYWREVSKATDTTVRVLNKKGAPRRHVLVSGKVSQVLQAKEMLELRLNQ